MKIQVVVSDEIVCKLDVYAKYIGVSRSALCAMFIGQGILGLDKSIQILEREGVGTADEIKGQLGTKDLLK